MHYRSLAQLSIASTYKLEEKEVHFKIKYILSLFRTTSGKRQGKQIEDNTVRTKFLHTLRAVPSDTFQSILHLYSS